MERIGNEEMVFSSFGWMEIGGKETGSFTFLPYQKLSVEKCVKVGRKERFVREWIFSIYFIHPVPSFSFLHTFHDQEL